MSDDDERTDATLNELLRASAPARTRITPVIEDELARMTVAAGDEMATAGRPRHTKRLAGLTVALAVLLGGAGAATAATLGDWPWAEDPDGSYFYTSPTGEECEVRLGKIESSSPEVEAIVRGIQARGHVFDEATIDAAYDFRLQDIRRYEAEQIEKGNDPLILSDAQIYEEAINDAIRAYIDKKLDETGIRLTQFSDDYSSYDYGYTSEIKCSEVVGG